jgi:hypothetical protein
MRLRASALGRGTSTAAAPTSPRAHRRRPRRDSHHPLFCVPSSPATQGGRLRLSHNVQSPRRRGASPPARSSRATISLLGFSSNTLGQCWNRGDRFVHREPHAGVAVANPPGSGAANHSSLGHMLACTAPSRTASRRITYGSQWEPGHARGCWWPKPHLIQGSRVARSV